MPEVPTLETERLLLTKYGSYETDVHDVQRNINDPKIANFITIPWPYPEDGAESFMKIQQEKMADGTAMAWGIRLKSKPEECVGCIDYRINDPETNTWGRGFWLASKHHGNGLMSEVVEATMSYMFEEVGIAKLEVENAFDNTESHRIKKKFGFRQVGEKGLVHPFRGSDPIPCEKWEITREEWLALRSPDIS